MSNDFMVLARLLPYLLGISHSLFTLSTQGCHPGPEFPYCNLTLLYSPVGGNLCSRWTRQIPSILLIFPPHQAQALLGMGDAPSCIMT